MKNIVVILFLITQSIFAQVQFEAKVSKNSMALNERLRVDFEMNADGDNFSPPNFEGFRVVGGPSQQVSQSWINGRSSFQKAYSYYLLPMQKGTIMIKQATVEIDGRVYKTNPIKITVGNAVQEGRDPNDLPQISAGDALHLVAEVSKQNPYINEPITVVYKLFFSYNIGITNWRELNKPKYNNFWSQNIDIKQLVAEEGTYNGEKYRYVVLRKTVLYPQKSGKLEIEPLSLDIDVQLPTNRRNIFGQVQIVEDNKRVSAPSRVINVKSLPEAGKPENFSGAVGSFSFKAIPTKTMLKNGESLDLKVVVSGKGNLKLFSLPKPVVPNSFEMYDPVHNENVQTPLTGMTGEMSDNYTIIPQFKGKYPIKPMSFSYFDLNSNSYKIITSPEIMVDVLDGPTNATNSVANNSTSSKNRILPSAQFQYIKSKTALNSINVEPFFGSTAFFSLLVAPFLLIPFVVLYKKKREESENDLEGNKIKRNNALAKKYLSEAAKHLQNKEPFYISLEKALHNFLKAKLKIETSEMSKEKISEILLAKKADSVTVSSFIKLIENCDFARYAPSTNSEIQNDYDKAVDLISILEKQIA